MPIIAYMGSAPETLAALHRAFPEFRLLHITPDGIESAAVEQELYALIVEEPISFEILARLARVKARDPALIVVARLPAEPDVAGLILDLGHAAVDDVLVARVEDHPTRLRATLARAAIRSIAGVIHAACGHLPPALVSPALEHVPEEIGTIKQPRALAAALGVPLALLRADLHTARMFHAKPLLGWWRTLVGTRWLEHPRRSVQSAAGKAGYSSPTAFRNACRNLVHASPAAIRGRGGLRYAARRFQHDLNRWRTRRERQRG